MPYAVMLRLVALVRTDVSVEPIVSNIRVTRIGELGSKVAVTSRLNHSAKKYKIRFASYC
jgi:hypothetical protein